MDIFAKVETLKHKTTQQIYKVTSPLFSTISRFGKGPFIVSTYPKIYCLVRKELGA